jgi:signal transduction histidine kinase
MGGDRTPEQAMTSQDESKDEFIKVMTHELKGSLTAIQGLVDVMLKGYVGDLNEKQRGLLNRIHNRIESLMDVSIGLWDIYQYRFGRPDIKRGPLPVKEIIQGTVDLFNSSALKKDLSIHLSLPEEDLVPMGTEHAFEIILHNLMTNAIKYTPRGGSISIGLSQAKDHLIIRFKDTGIGIASGDIPKIFDEFFRTKESKKIDPHGRGLGLSLVKKVVETSGGTIKVKSDKGKGAEFILKFPMKNE